MINSKGRIRYHFVGIGGVGMSALAQIIKAQGYFVSGSDRKINNNLSPEVFCKLKSQGIELFPQDGSGIDSTINLVVISSAIEENNLDIRMANQHNVQIIKRSELLSALFNDKHGIAVGGSNGKTTVCGMISWVLDKAGYNPTVVGGGYVKNYVTNSCLGNARLGASRTIVIEADESDDSIIDYKPKISVITDISKDHKTIDELGDLFSKFAENTSGTIIINESCTHLIKVNGKNKAVVGYGEGSGADVRVSQIFCSPIGSRFEINDSEFELKIPGLFNVFNALAAIAVARVEGVSDNVIKKALSEFKGIKRRMEIVGERKGVRVIDDYAHNPKKIKSAIDAVRTNGERIILIYQPHGYSPTNFLREDIVYTFAKELLPNDILIMPEIFYAGGTAKKVISSKEIVDELTDMGINASFFIKREDIIDEVKSMAKPGDCVLVMGARDDSLTDFCCAILNRL